MKILHVVSSLQKASGVTTFVENVVAEMRERGYTVDVVSKADSVNRVDVLKKCDLIHIHGLWEPWLHRWAKNARQIGLNVVWSPHGMLTQWAFHYKWWKKLPAWYLYQKKDLSGAAFLHVTAESEVDDVRREGLRNKVIIAPLGVRLHKDELVTLSDKRQGSHTLLFVSRVQRKKGLVNLVRAWAEIKGIANEWNMRIVGPDQEGHTAELKSLAKQLGVDDRIDLVGPKYGDELTKEYASADCFILPSHSENFGSVVLEALAVGTPVIASKGTPWKILEDEECGFWVENDPDSLSSVLLKMMKLTDDERAQMGARGRRLVEKRYTWAAVCDKMVRGYEEVLNGRT